MHRLNLNLNLHCLADLAVLAVVVLVVLVVFVLVIFVHFFFIEFSLACMPSEFGSNITEYKAITNAI